MTAEQAALDVACNRRSQLPGARPAPEVDALADNPGRARLHDKRIIVGKYDYERATPEQDYTGYSYAGRYAAADVDILLHDDGDSIGWLLINQNAGALDVGHLLIPSPDGQLWAETISWEAPPGAINLYVLEPSAWKKVATLPVAFACDLRWTGSDSLTFRTSMDFSSPPGDELHAKFKDGQLALLDK